MPSFCENLKGPVSSKNAPGLITQSPEWAVLGLCRLPRGYFAGEGREFLEPWPGAMRELYGGVTGYIYTLLPSKSENRFNGGYKSLPPFEIASRRWVAEAYGEILNFKDVKIVPFEEQTPRQRRRAAQRLKRPGIDI